jgi:flagellar motor component MotA
MIAKQKPLSVTHKNFKKAVNILLGKEFAEVVKNPTTQLEKAICVAFIEQPERKDPNVKKYVKLLRRVARRLRRNGEFRWDTEK